MKKGPGLSGISMLVLVGLCMDMSHRMIANGFVAIGPQDVTAQGCKLSLKLAKKSPSCRLVCYLRGLGHGWSLFFARLGG